MFLHTITTSLLMAWVVPGQAVTTETTVEVQNSILLHDAVRQGKVKVEVKSLGRAHGAGVRVEVERLVPENLHIEVAPGTVLINAQGGEQNVTVGQLKGEFTRENMYKPGKVMVLVDGQRRSFLLDIYCLDYAKKSLSAVTAFNAYIGYEKAAEVAKESLRTGKTIPDLIVEKGYMTKERVDEILQWRSMTEPGIPGAKMAGG